MLRALAQAAAASAASGAAASAPEASEGPCDILTAAGNPCVAAHSTTRALYAAYDGPLYKVTRASDGKTADVGVLVPGGFANVATHDAFCVEQDCVIQNVFDQSPMGNHLGPRHKLVNASQHRIIVGDEVEVYGMWFDPGYGYHVDDTKGVPTGNEPESIYAVMSGTHYNGHCCFDYGNSENSVAAHNKSQGAGTMEAIYFGNANWQGNRGGGPMKPNPNAPPPPSPPCAAALAATACDSAKGNTGQKSPGACEACLFRNASLLGAAGCTPGNAEAFCGDGGLGGPWVGADLECGMYYGGGNETKVNENSKPLPYPFVSLYLGGRTDGFVLKGGNAQGGTLDTQYDGPRPDCAIAGTCNRHPIQNASGTFNRTYQPADKKGAIILATGGDMSNSAMGKFYEGMMVTGATTAETDAAVQANIVAVRYKNIG